MNASPATIEPGPAGMLTPDVHGQFGRRWTRNQVGDAEQVEKALARNPAAPLDAFTFHERHVRRGTAEGGAPEAEKERRYLNEPSRHLSHAPRRSSALRKHCQLLTVRALWRYPIRFTDNVMVPSHWRPHACALAGYVVVALAFVWPLPLHLDTHLTGSPERRHRGLRLEPMGIPARDPRGSPPSLFHGTDSFTGPSRKSQPA